MPQNKGQESGGMLGQVVRWKITEPGRMDSGIFQAWERTAGARVLSYLRGLGVLSLVWASFLAPEKRGKGSRE